MQYMGGKARQAKHIVNVLSMHRKKASRYVEPFMGSAAILHREAPFHDYVVASDAHPDLVQMWKMVMDGWCPPNSISIDEYNELKDSISPSALRGFAGFGMSFGGKWFGGYVKNARGDDFCGAAKRSVLRKAINFRHAEILNQDYRELEIQKGDLVYCDPPYGGTTSYSGVDPFDSYEFWQVAREWAAKGATVLVSEYDAPSDVECVWSRSAVKSLRKDSNTLTTTEKLFLIG